MSLGVSLAICVLLSDLRQRGHDEGLGVYALNILRAGAEANQQADRGDAQQRRCRRRFRRGDDSIGAQRRGRLGMIQEECPAGINGQARSARKRTAVRHD